MKRSEIGAYGGGMLGAVLGTVTPNSDHQVILDELEKGGALLCVECQPAQAEEIKTLLELQHAKRVEIVSPADLGELKEN